MRVLEKAGNPANVDARQNCIEGNGPFNGDTARVEAFSNEGVTRGGGNENRTKTVHSALSSRLEVLWDLMVGESFPNKESERVKEKLASFLKEVNVYKMDPERIEKMLLEMHVEKKSMRRCIGNP